MNKKSRFIPVLYTVKSRLYHLNGTANFVVLLLVMAAQLPNNCIAQFRIDTIYYDKNWDVVQVREFADYYRIALYDENNPYRNKCRDYFMTGELHGEAGFISLGTPNDSTSVWNGETVMYYKNGKKQLETHYVNGVREGLEIAYFDNGLIKHQLIYRNGLINGIMTIFNEDGSYMQHEYSMGKPALPYYVKGNSVGQRIKIDYNTNLPIIESPSKNCRNVVYRDGAEWQWYDANGFVVAANAIYSQGIFVRLYITNNSGETILIDETNITGTISNKKGKYERQLKPIPYEKFVRSNATTAFILGAAVYATESMAAKNAGKRSSLSNATTISGWGVSSTYSATIGYDAAAAYQAKILAEQKSLNVSNTIWNELTAKEVGYLRKNTIYTGETVSGHVSMRPKSGNSSSMRDWVVHLIIEIKGSKYEFDLTLE